MIRIDRQHFLFTEEVNYKVFSWGSNSAHVVGMKLKNVSSEE